MKKNWYKNKVQLEDGSWIDENKVPFDENGNKKYYKYNPVTQNQSVMESSDGKYFDLNSVYGINGFADVWGLATKKEQAILDEAEFILMKYAPQLAHEMPPLPNEGVEILDEDEYEKVLASFAKDRQVNADITRRSVMSEFAKMRKNNIIRCNTDKILIEYIMEMLSIQDGWSFDTMQGYYTNFNKGTLN